MKRIAILAGDGIGPEIMTQAKRILMAIVEKYQIDINIQEALIGGAAYEQYGKHFPDETKAICDNVDAILFGSVGGPISGSQQEKWQNCEAQSILAIRKHYQLSANLRPAKIFPELQAICPLKNNIIREGIDIMIIRELIGDIYFGEHKREMINHTRTATDVAYYDEKQIAAVAHIAFQTAQKRNKNICSVDKANVLATSKLWREIMDEISREYPDVNLTHMLVDNCAMQLIKNPSQFDVIVTANMFGDILSDAASVLPGSIGLMPSASFNQHGFALYEPSGGSAPDIAGQGIANPIAQILSVALMMEYTFQHQTAANNIKDAINKTLQANYRTQDIMEQEKIKLSTKEFSNEILKRI